MFTPCPVFIQSGSPTADALGVARLSDRKGESLVESLLQASHFAKPLNLNQASEESFVVSITILIVLAEQTCACGLLRVHPVPLWLGSL